MEDSGELKHLRYLPMAVGTISPFSFLLGVLPVVGSWINIANIRLSNPPYIIICGSVGLGFLLLANLVLISRFLGKKTTITTFLSIVFYFLHGSITFILVIYFYSSITLLNNQSYSPEFYIEFVSPFVSFFLALLILLDYIYTKKAHIEGLRLSKSQRKMILCSITLSIWLAIGGIIYSRIEKWTFTQALYFSLVTLTTIGFGDFTPKDLAGKLVLFFYASIGIIIMGLFIKSLRLVILESFRSKLMNAVEDFSVQRLENFTNRFRRSTPNFTRTTTRESTTTIERKNNVKNRKTTLLKTQFIFSLSLFLLFWFLGAGLFSWFEKWTYFDALYFCFISFTTIGFGDFEVTDFNSTIIFICYALIGIVTMSYLVFVLTEMVEVFIENKTSKAEIERKHKFHLKRLSLAETIDFIDVRQVNNDNELISKFLAVAKLYQHHMQSYIEIHKPDLINEDSQDWQKLVRYNRLYEKMVDLCEVKFNINTESGN